jgi:lipid-binding SYLF domain-containing protein
MKRLLLKVPSALASAMLIVMLAVVFTVPLTGLSHAATARELEISVDVALEKFYEEVTGGKEFISESKGYLLFPRVIKAGLGIGGEHGEGALRVGGRTVDYYSTTAGSVGFQLGVQQKTVLVVFMTNNSLKKFRNSSGWKAGVDGSVALIKVGVGGSVDTANIKAPIVGFVYGQKGLMYNLTLEGSKFTKLKKEK